MRILGIDSAYHRPEDNLNIVFRSLKEKRVVITRDLKLINSAALKVFIVKSGNYRFQLKETLKEFNIDINREKIFTRCPECNSELVEADKKNIKGKVSGKVPGKVPGKIPAYVYDKHDKFSICADCKKIYWEGTHKKLIENILKDII
jgi:uncharacterized protein with PIN domain